MIHSDNLWLCAHQWLLQAKSLSFVSFGLHVCLVGLNGMVFYRFQGYCVLVNLGSVNSASFVKYVSYIQKSSSRLNGFWLVGWFFKMCVCVCVCVCSSSGYPGTRFVNQAGPGSTCLCLQGAGVKGVCCHTRLKQMFFKATGRWGYSAVVDCLLVKYKASVSMPTHHKPHPPPTNVEGNNYSYDFWFRILF